MILLTGATGFLGSRILKELVRKGYEVICLKRAYSNCKRVKEVYDTVKWFVIDGNSMELLFCENQIDTVIHCATNYGRDDVQYFETYEANLVFPFQLIKYAEKYGCPYFINTSTFFNRELQHVENDECRVYMDAYVRSKNMFCRIIRNHIEQLPLAFIDLQLEHVYGNNDDSSKFVTFLWESLQKNSSEISLSSGEQKRDWIYVDDVVSAYMTILNHLSEFAPSAFYSFEVGTGIDTDLMTFAEVMKAKLNSGTKLKFGKYSMRDNELVSSKADISKLSELGWKPRYDIDRGIEQMIKERQK